MVRGVPRILYNILPLSINNSIEQICGDIDRFQPEAMSGYSSAIGLLAQEQIAGHINITPQMIWCGADALTPTIRKNVEKAFGVNPINMYAASETMSFSAECQLYHRLHVFEDWFSVQVVDDNLKHVKPGNIGRIIITSLYNYTQPLIRYRLNDEVILSPEVCQCGWPFVVIDKIAGRQEETLWFTRLDGTREFIHSIMLIEFFVPGLEKFQFIQTNADRLTMKAVIHGEKDSIIPAIHKRMAEILSQKTLIETVHFDVELVDSIQNDPKTGKFRLIIPYTFVNL